MRKILLPFIILLFATAGKAQYVNIPDSNFRNFLIATYPSCFNASGQMDTTCSAVVNTLQISCLGNNVISLEGIQYFKRLSVLDCRNNLINYIPKFPDSLYELRCSDNKLTSFPNFPDSLKYISCDGNLLTSLPSLPPKLDYLDCGGNPNLTCLPLIPYSLRNLFIDSVIHCLPNYLNQTAIVTVGGFGSGISCPPVCSALNNTNGCNNVNGNFVNISDAYFREFLMASFPACFNAYAQMDTTCSGIINATTLNGGMGALYWAKYINDALPYFKNLKHLEVWDAFQMDEFPKVNDSLEFLDISGTAIKKIPALPSNLKVFFFERTLIDTIPTLPNGLQVLSMSNAMMDYTGFSSSYMENPNLTFLPALPNSLYDLKICAPNLTSLPVLPSGLWELAIRSDKITLIDSFPKRLNLLGLFKMPLTNINAFPDSLQTLILQKLPINCLPKLPNTIFNLGLDMPNVKCIPNIPSSYQDFIGLPLCNPATNANQCQPFPYIKGNVFIDYNNNGVQDIYERNASYTKMSLSDGQSAFSNWDGSYLFTKDTLGNFTVKPIAPQYYKAVPDSFNFSVTNYDTNFTANFALKVLNPKDSLHINGFNWWRTRPGFTTAYAVYTNNIGTTNLYATISFTYDSSRLVFNSASLPVASHIGNVITLVGDTVYVGQNKLNSFYFTVKNTAVIGDSLFASATVTANALTDTTVIKNIIRGSFDPNDKTATPELSTIQVTAGKKIDYTIRFQNTGNDTAYHVVIADTLDSKLDYNTLQMVATSHNCKTSITNNVIFFEMRNIMLPDSNVNKLGSNGFIRFTMQPKSTVVAGDNIPNKAAIYFDYNAPVITNTAVTQIKNPLLPLKITNYELRITNEGSQTLPLGGRGVVNIWKTSNEINVSHFIIQRNEVGRVFKSVGTVAAKGNGAYSFTDNLQGTQIPSLGGGGSFYYRLQIVDKDGNYSFSETKQIRLNQLTDKQINIYPNPATTIVSIDCNNAKQISIVDYLGRIIKQFNNPTAHQTINTKQINKGIYMVKVIMNNGEVKTDKLIVE